MRISTKTAAPFLSLALLTFASTGCKSSPGGTTPASAAAAALANARQLKLQGFTVDAETRKGVALTLEVGVANNREMGLNLTLAASTPEDAEESLRSTLSVATRMAARLAGRPLKEIAVSLSCPGAPDGADIGTLLAAGVLAALKGASIAPDAAVLGTLLVGTAVGPVAGLPQQLRAAAKAGKKRIGYPLGQQRAYDFEQAKLIDIKPLAASLGVTLVELHTIHDAYALLTGQKLDPVGAVSAAAMALSKQEHERLLNTTRAVFDQSREILRKEAAEAGAGTGSAAAANEQDAKLKDEATSALEKVATSLTEGRAIKAFSQALVARTAVLAYRVSSALGRATAADLERGERIFEQVRSQIINEVALRKFRFEVSLDHALWDIAVYQRLLVAGLFSIWSRDRLREAAVLASSVDEQKNQEARKQRELAIVHGSDAWTQLQTAQDLDKLQVDQAGRRLVFDETALRDISVGYLHTSRATLSYYHNTIKPLLAQHADLDEELLSAISEGVQAIPDLLIAEKWGSKSAPTALVRLAGAKESLVQAALLMHAGLFPDEADQHTETALLQIAERTARELAHAAQRAVGAVPLTARLAYEIGRSYATQGHTTDALELYWRSSLESHVVLALAGAAKPAQ